MKKLLLVFIMLIALSCFVSADTIQLNASDATHMVTDHWVTNPGYTSDKMYDEDWTTYSYPVGFYEASIFWWYSTDSYGLITNASWNITSTDGYSNIVYLPSACLNNPIKLKATGHFIVGDKTFWSCYTSSYNWLLLDSMNPSAATISEQSLTIENETAPAPPSCSLTCPGETCIFFDDMTYADSFANCSYVMNPESNLIPTIFYDVYSLYADQKYELFMHDVNYAGNTFLDVYDTYSLFWGCAAGQCEPFWDTSGHFQHQLIYQRQNSNDYSKYDITFYYDVSTHYITGFYLTPENYYESFCTDCFEPYAGGHKIEIYSYNGETTKTFYNVTLGAYQVFSPDSISIFIDGIAVAYNVPALVSYQPGDLPKKTNYIISKQVLMYSPSIYGGVMTPPITETDYKDNNDFCSDDSECLSQYCYIGKCTGMAGGASCTKDENCLSGECKNGLCSNPGLWKIIDTKAKSLAGDSEADLTLVSIFIILLVFGLAVYVAKGAAWGFAAGGAIGLILMFFFTFSGWMSPFVFIAAIMLLLGGIFYMLFHQSGG
jgi:hypothetical protein